MIQSVKFNPNREVAFGGKSNQSKKFSSLMNYLYKKSNNLYEFENRDVIELTTKINNKDVTAFAKFKGGKFTQLVFAKGEENLSEVFKKVVLKRFNDYMSKGKINPKTGKLYPKVSTLAPKPRDEKFIGNRNLFNKYK